MIVSSAVKFVEHGYPIIVGGKRHCDCYKAIQKFVPKERFVERRKANIVKEGFITSDNKFLERDEAAQYAYRHGQIGVQKYELFSEDLWWGGMAWLQNQI